MQKEYTSKELNEMIGYVDISGQNSGKQQLMTRCRNAGLILQDLPTKRGCPNKYIIIENNFLLPGEEWKICCFNDDWEISNMGRVRRKATKKLMGSASDTEYVRICMIDKETGKSKNIQRNRAVFFTFNPDLLEIQDKIQIDHINGIRHDDRLENLRAVSPLQNTQAREENQTKVKTLVTELILKYGYEETENLIKKMLDN